MIRLILGLSLACSAFASDQFILDQVFQSVLTEKQKATLARPFQIEAVARILQPEQKTSVRQELQRNEPSATPDELKEIARGYSLLNAGEPGGANVARVGIRLQQLEPEKTDGAILASQGFAQAGDYPAAASWAKRVLEIDPGNRKAQEIYAFSYGRTGRGGGKAGASSPTTLGGNSPLPTRPATSAEGLSLMRKAAEARKMGDIEGAWNYVQAAMQTDPTSPAVQELYTYAKADREKHLRRGQAFVPIEVVSTAETPRPTPSPFWPIGAGLGLTAIGYGVARSRKTWSQTEDADSQVEVDAEDDARWRRNAKALGISAAIGFGIAYGGAWLAPRAIPLLTGASQVANRVAGSEAGMVGPSAGMRFALAPRVLDQLNDPRLGHLAGRLSIPRLQELAGNPSARRFLDARTGNINIIQEVEGMLLRITVPKDELKIISVGPIRSNQVQNRIASGDFIPLR